MLALTIVFAHGSTASAQFSIKIPKLPKMEKPKTEQPKPYADRSTSAPQEEPYKRVDARIRLFRDEVKEVRRSAEDADSVLELIIAQKQEWVLRAISPKEREEFFTKWGELMSPEDKQFFTTELDGISAAITQKISQKKPNPSLFTLHNPADEKMMRGELASTPGLIIHKIGMSRTTWAIGKNEWGLIINRYKQGTAWVRNPASDDPFCRLYDVNIIQDYAGGGTYGASYASSVGVSYAPCPAEK